MSIFNKKAKPLTKKEIEDKKWKDLKRKWRNDDIKDFIFIVSMFIAGYFISWLITCGILYFIFTYLFNINFSLKIATGIWLILCLFKAGISK